ncbi:uncharacterized protein K460DRAFT_311606, partial [Cucurbitaria berberidis CBS 394.84]
MTSPTATTLQSQLFSNPGRRSMRVGEGEAPGKKPKKANSEIRKQQNRIASRNYRDKRKRKLQYLQQLIKGDSNNQQDAEPSPEHHNVYARSLTADYEPSGPSSSPYQLPSNNDIGSRSSSSASVSDSIQAASAASFDSHLLGTTQAYAAFGPNWNAPLYSPPPPLNMSPWNISPWMSNIDGTPRVPSRPEVIPHTTPSGPPVFTQAHASSQQPRELLSDPNYYTFGSSFGSESQTPGIPNVSLPISSPYYLGLYPGP